MNFVEQLQTLDTSDFGRWPLLFRALFISIVFAIVVGGGIYYFVVKKQVPVLERHQGDERKLLKEFDTKQRKAANLDAYKAQLLEMQDSFGSMLGQLPGKTEIQSLLVDISQTGLASGLEEKLFQPGDEIKRDFYAELPISIRLTGTYHELGRFVSGIAALPRIVTLHDIKVSQPSDQEDLTLNVTAKTYRYLEEDEQ